jgi:hypothetical protein
MLVVDVYNLLPALTLAGFLLILLWPENIAYRNRLRLMMGMLILWIAASGLGMAGYGAATENRPVCFINLIVGCLGLIAVYVTYQTHPARKTS